jgi:raffinose synthase
VPFSPVKTLPLGDLITSEKLLAAARLTRYWMGPKFGKTAKDIPVETQFLLLQLTDDDEANTASTTTTTTPSPPKYAVMMPLVDGGCRSTLEGSELRNRNGKETALDLVTYSENGGRPETAGETMNAMYVAVGSEDPYQLIQRSFREVSSTLGTFKTLSEKTIPSTVNDFGWCTWDAFYSRVHPKGILEGMKVLKDAGVPARNLILDDGWQHVSPEPEEWTTTRNTHELMEPNEEDDMAVVIKKANVTMHSSKSSQPALLLFAKVVGTAIFDFAARGLTHFYERHVQHSSHDSLASRIWTFLARKTLLKQGLYKYFDEETDFCRQLDDFEPNWKFQGSEGKGSDDRHVGGDSEMSLGDLVRTLKSELAVKKVYCWHALHGYWRGVTNEIGDSIGINVTQIFTKPSEKLLRMEPQMAYDTPTLWGAGMIDSQKDLKTFYDHLHQPLVNAGVDGVKVDVQSGVSAAGSGVKGDNKLAMAYTQAMENSVSERFPGDDGAVEVINCMCHSTENLYRYNTTAIARASDDFYPDRSETWTVHLVNVAYNSTFIESLQYQMFAASIRSLFYQSSPGLFMGEITLPDWDMFHSKHKSAELHGAARAIGGVPVYVSDVPGEHDIDLLKKLVLPDGSILRAQNHGRPTRDCLFADVGQDGTSALKVWNTNRNEVLSGGRSGGGVVGAFNVQGIAWDFAAHDNRATIETPDPITTTIKPHDVETLRPFGGPFAVWSYRSGSLDVLPIGSSTIRKTIDPHEWDVLTVEPIQQNEHVQWAPIGLGDMINSGGALSHVGALEDTVTTTNSTYGEDAGDGGLRETTTAEISTRGPGRFVAYCQPAPSRVMINGKPPRLDFAHDEKTGLLVFTLPNESGERNPHQVTVVWDQKKA